VSVETGAEPLLTAARDGDDRAFQALVAPHLRALHLHSYRMLGSFHDAEEAVQETLLRAWRGLDGYESRAPLRHWLYRISTTTCLKMIDRRSRGPVTSTLDVAWPQPYPDPLLDQLADTDADPAAIVDRRESVAWPAQQVADLLDTGVAAVNSSLQRARATLATSHGSPAAARAGSAHERRVVAEFLRAWHARDLPALAALLRDEAREQCDGYGIMVLTITGDGITAITGFPDAELFPTFDLPTTR
jgi:RNA polymerase sigma-70 factor (ECF subfamily)